MIDLEKIKDKYNKLKSLNYANLLSLDKIIALEEAKDNIIEKYLSKIDGVTKIKGDYQIITKDNFTIEEIIKYSKPKFGDLNFFEGNKEDDKITIDLAFHFCIISISYSLEKVKYKVTVFWDV